MRVILSFHVKSKGNEISNEFIVGLTFDVNGTTDIHMPALQPFMEVSITNSCFTLCSTRFLITSLFFNVSVNERVIRKTRHSIDYLETFPESRCYDGI